LVELTEEGTDVLDRKYAPGQVQALPINYRDAFKCYTVRLSKKKTVSSEKQRQYLPNVKRVDPRFAKRQASRSKIWQTSSE